MKLLNDSSQYYLLAPTNSYSLPTASLFGHIQMERQKNFISFLIQSVFLTKWLRKWRKGSGGEVPIDHLGSIKDHARKPVALAHEKGVKGVFNMNHMSKKCKVKNV
jgi:hypothetical protein